MKKLLTSLSLMLAVLIGSTGVSYAEDKSPIKELDNQITIGNADYNNATTTINLNITFKKDPTKISLSFQHSLNSDKHSRTFSMKLLNCTFSGFPESGKANLFCQLAKNTNLRFTKFSSKNLLEIEFLNAAFGSANLDLRSNSDLSKINFTGSLTNLNNPLFSMYKKLNGYINTNNLKGEVVVIKKNGEELRESLVIKNNAIYYKRARHPITSEQMSLINDYIKASRDILKSDESVYYFGGEKVDQGKVLKKEILSLLNIIQPSLLTGYTVLGTTEYLDRASIVVKPKMDFNHLPNTIKSQLGLFGITFGQNDLVYIDQLLGIPNFWKQTVSGQFLDKVGTLRVAILGNTAFPKTAKNSASSNDIQSRLSKLKKLLDSGLITKEEAAEKRKAILDNL
jgi:hypothetical protein